MDQFETRLRDALRQPEPPPYLTAKVIGRVGVSGRKPRYAIFAVAAAVLAWLVVSVAILERGGIGKSAIAQIADGSLYLISAGGPTLVHGTGGIPPSVPVRSNGRAALSLIDGSQVEMRSDSELLLQRANDGLLLHLNVGSIIVTAAKQPGHFYVQTTDVTVSVIGTIFLVEAGKEGTRVGVMEGEVRVQQGRVYQNLHPGQEVTSNSIVQWAPLTEELSWSRNATAHLAMLERSAKLLQQPSGLAPLEPQPQNPPETHPAFEVTSVRAGDVAPDSGGRGGAMPFGFGCGGSFLQVDPGRFAISSNLYTLVAIAHGKPCVSTAKLNLLSGGPGGLSRTNSPYRRRSRKAHPHTRRANFLPAMRQDYR
jgi:hypothetical protein